MSTMLLTAAAQQLHHWATTAATLLDSTRPLLLPLQLVCEMTQFILFVHGVLARAAVVQDENWRGDQQAD